MRYSLWLVFVCAVSASGDWRRAAGEDPAGASVAGTPQVSVTPQDDRVRVLLDGQPFAEYVFQGYSRPIVFPIIGPHSLGMTRNWPMRDGVAGESHDHPHQKALFVGFGAVNGVDFFSEFPGAGKIVHRELLNAESGTQRGWLKATNDWVANDGRVVCSDTRLLAFQAVPGGRAIDVEITLHASHGDVKFADDKHGLLAIRMHPNLQLDNDPAAGVTTANGQVVNSEGVRGAAVFGKRARWIDYWGTIDGHTVGIAMFDHPSNPRHPTWWMARGYGYCAADPFGGSSIGGEPPGTGDLTIPAGLSATFCYRLVFHEGDPDQAKIDELYRSYADRMTRALSQFNRGAALLEQYQYQEAAEAFEETLRLFPQWTAARFNLGLACLSDRSADLSKTVDRAREAFEQVLMAEPNHLHARYCLGVYYELTGDDRKALECFQQVYQADEEDPSTAYRYAETLFRLDRKQEACVVFENLIALDPGFTAAYLRLFQHYRETEQADKARAYMERFTELRKAEFFRDYWTRNGLGYSAGRYAIPLGVESLPLAERARPAATRMVVSPDVHRLDVQLKPWDWAAGCVKIPGIAVGDVNADGHLDLVLTATEVEGATSVWINDGKGNFARASQIASGGVSPCLGDVDNDGDLDLWLGRSGGDLLLVNDGQGHLVQAQYPWTEADQRLTVCARLIDVDGDGLLDLTSLKWGSGSIPAAGELKPGQCMILGTVHSASSLAGRGSGAETKASPVDLAPDLGLAMPEENLAGILQDDFDNDRDLDLILLPAQNLPILWVNDRAGKYRMLDAQATGLAERGIISAMSGDPYKTGSRDLLLFGGSQLFLYRNRGGHRFELDQGFAARCGWLGGTGGQWADLDNDGDLDLVIADAHRRDGTRGPSLLVNDWPELRFTDVTDLDPGNLLSAIRTQGDASCVVADLNADGKLDILLAEMGAQPLWLENVTDGGHFIQLDLAGQHGVDGKSQSPVSPLGARVEVHAGTVAQQFVVGLPSGPTAMPPLTVHAGLGVHTQVQWLRIHWPDSVLQAELELAAGQVHRITQHNRLRSTCPHLYAWDGARFALVSDFAGVGGLGYWLAPGVYAVPRPREYVPIGRLEPQDGQYVLQVLESLEESVYVDEAKLIAVDHPNDTAVYPHELMAIGVPAPPFELFCVRDVIEPVRAIDHRQLDVTEELRQIDRRYAGATDRHERLYGYARDHCVQLDFGDQLQTLASDARVIMYCYGTTEYPYSHTNYAASREGLRMEAPSVLVQRDGQWIELLHEVGCPAGMQHIMTVDLTGKLLATDQQLAMSSNMEIYWDRIFLAVHRPEIPLRIQEIAVQSADLHFRGYAKPYSPDGQRPELYDYERVDRSVPWNLMTGAFTRYGAVGELLHATDDCYVIMGRGDELTLRFPADAFGPVAPGYRRSFILKADAYSKDMSLYTAFADTVEPLPFHAMRNYPYGPDEAYPDTDQTRDYRARFNTRRVD